MNFRCLLHLLTEMSPLEAINRSQVTNLAVLETRSIEELACAVAVPNSNILSLEQLCVGGAFDEPKQLLCHGAPKHALCRQQWKLITKIESHLCTEEANGANAGAISSGYAYAKSLTMSSGGIQKAQHVVLTFLHNLPDQVQILLLVMLLTLNSAVGMSIRCLALQC